MKPLTCNEACAAGFASDREHGLIYGPNLYTDKGKTFVAMDREEWSHITSSCAYCGADIESADVTIQNEGGVLIFNLNTDAARAWVDENVIDDKQWWGKHGLVVELRHADEIAHGMKFAGLELA